MNNLDTGDKCFLKKSFDLQFPRLVGRTKGASHEKQDWHSCVLISDKQMTLKKFSYGCEYILLIAVYFILGLYYPSLSNQYFPIYPYSLSLSRRQLLAMPILLSVLLL